MIYKSIDEFNEISAKAVSIQIHHDDDPQSKWISYSYGEVDAMGDLADMYYAGTFIEIKRDFDKAYEWYTKAAKLGHIHSIRTLGNAYQDGYGVEKNVEEASKWFEKGSELGDEYCRKRYERLNREKNDENTNS